MTEVLQFTGSESAFDPDAIKRLGSAFDDAWATIQKSGSRFAKPGYARAMREVMAKRIFEMAQKGESDRAKLSSDAVAFVTTNYNGR